MRQLERNLRGLRFLGNDEVSWEGILAPHWERTQERMREHPVVLCIQDTTELDFNGQEAEGLGPLNYEARRGMYLHPTYAVTPGREPLGVLDAWMWAREMRDADGVRHGQKESARWIEGYERVAEMAANMADTRLVYVADREADLVAMMRRARELDTPVDWLVRAKHNRCLPDGDGDKLWVRIPWPCDHRFHANPATHSTPIQPPIPRQSSHRFHANPATRSTAIRPPDRRPA